MRSILQDDNTHCFLCGMNANLERLDCHHVFGASNRKKSEQYGLKVYLHHNKCHLYGAHKNNNINNQLKVMAQTKAMEYYGWDVDTFRSIFGKNYL